MNIPALRIRIVPQLCYLFIVFISILTLYSGHSEALTLDSYILRNRVVLLDRIVMKKALYVAFSLGDGASSLQEAKVKGRLAFNNRVLAKSIPAVLQGKKGNLIFDLPYKMPDGIYTIRIEVSDVSGKILAHGNFSVDRVSLKSTSETDRQERIVRLQEMVAPGGQDVVNPAPDDVARGYIAFSRSPLEYIFPGTRPVNTEIVKSLSVRAVKNKIETITLALYPLQDLGAVQLSVTTLQGTSGTIFPTSISIGTVETVSETRGAPEGRFINIPGMIKPAIGRTVEVSMGQCRRFWISLRIHNRAQPGIYQGHILVTPQFGQEQKIPLTVEVVPVSIEDVADKDYFMLMTYEFTELTMPWSAEKQKLIYRAAGNILKDYKNHGMTTLCIHSPFALSVKEDGTPALDDIFAALRSAKEHGFTRPLIWYMGHLLQTAKPKHPGNIAGFDENIVLPRLRYLVKTVIDYANAIGYPGVVFLPVDEPDDSFQDIHEKRRKITPLLLKTIHDAGGKTMITNRSFDQFQPVDYISSSEMNEKELQKAHAKGSRYWMYNNRVAETCNNPAYARYIYGFYTWSSNIDGMSSWTFQNTQNAGGPPANMGEIGRDPYLAYPDPKGPLSTLVWEGIREGIDDHKILYQLIKRIRLLKNKGFDTGKYESFLDGVRTRLREPGCTFDDRTGWQPVEFERTRDSFISLITEADRSLMAPITVNKGD
jgi:hypothetical protein